MCQITQTAKTQRNECVISECQLNQLGILGRARAVFSAVGFSILVHVNSALCLLYYLNCLWHLIPIRDFE